MRLLEGIFCFGNRSAREDFRTAPSGATRLWENAPDLATAEGAVAASEGSSDAQHNLCLWIGRLDNHSSLRKALGSEGGNEASTVLRLYRKEGCQGLRELIGDWSAIIWDARAEAVVLASDYAGMLPLYYSVDGRRLIWSSRLRNLICGQEHPTLDEESVGSFLDRGTAARAGRTLYRGVHVVPPGRAVHVSAKAIQTHRFWNLPVSQVTRYRQDEEYESHLFRLFEEGIAARLKTPEPVVAELSGGLDSSSVVSMAHRLVVSRQVESPQLVTLCYDQPDSSDAPFVAAVEEKFNLSALRMPITGAEFLPAELKSDQPVFWEGRFLKVSEEMRRQGATTLLTGQAGDLVMANWSDDSEQAGDLLAAGQLTGCVREAIAWGQSLREPIYPILWRALQLCVSPKPRRSRDLTASPAALSFGASLTPVWSKRAAALRMDPIDSGWLSEAPPSRRKRLWALNEILEHRNLSTPELLGDASWTHPFTHRPLVEFAMTVPPAVMCRPGVSRRLMRRAFRGILPNSVLHRRSKATCTQLHRQALLPRAVEFSRLPDRLRLVELGYVDPSSLRVRLERLEQGLECNEPQLRRLILLEIWLAHQQKGSSRPSSEAHEPELSLL